MAAWVARPFEKSILGNPVSDASDVSCNSSAPASRAERDLPLIQRTGPGILVVDDDDQVRAMLDRFLRLSGFQVYFAASGVEAAVQLSTYRSEIALALIDVCMSGLDGVQTLVL